MPSPITELDPERFAQVLRRWIRAGDLLGARGVFAEELVDLAVQRLQGVDHVEVTSEVLERLDAEAGLRALEPLGSERLFDLARVYRSLGLFTCSAPFEEAAMRALERESLRARGSRRDLLLVAVGIARGDRELASTAAQRVRHRGLIARHGEIQLMLGYVDLWSGAVAEADAVATADAAGARMLRQLVDGRRVVVCGPALTVPEAPAQFEDDPVARVLAPGVTRWDSASDPAANRTDVVYFNGETTAWLVSMDPSEARHVVEPFRVLGVRPSWAERFRAHVRRPVHVTTRLESKHRAVHRSLVDGHLNMAQTMAFDLLCNGAASVHLTGVTFFVGATPYAPESRRFVDGQGRVDAFDSTDQSFRKSLGLANHNPLVNRRFLANLMDAGVVDGDAAFRNAAALSDLDYLRELDLHYGLPAR